MTSFYAPASSIDLGHIYLSAKNFKIAHSFWMESDGPFIFYMCIPKGKTFSSYKGQSYQSNLRSDTMVTFSKKTLTMAITFEWSVIQLSFFTCVHLMVRPSCGTKVKAITPSRSRSNIKVTFFLKIFSIGHDFERWVIDLSFAPKLKISVKVKANFQGHSFLKVGIPVSQTHVVWFAIVIQHFRFASSLNYKGIERQGIALPL